MNPVRTPISLTLNLLTTTIVAPRSNASKWQMGFNSAFKGLRSNLIQDWPKRLTVFEMNVLRKRGFFNDIIHSMFMRIYVNHY